MSTKVPGSSSHVKANSAQQIFPRYIFSTAAIKCDFINSPWLSKFPCFANRWTTWRFLSIATSFCFLKFVNKFCDEILRFKLSYFSDHFFLRLGILWWLLNPCWHVLHSFNPVLDVLCHLINCQDNPHSTLPWESNIWNSLFVFWHDRSALITIFLKIKVTWYVDTCGT